jgi:hypothetical protein
MQKNDLHNFVTYSPHKNIIFFVFINTDVISYLRQIFKKSVFCIKVILGNRKPTYFSDRKLISGQTKDGHASLCHVDVQRNAVGQQESTKFDSNLTVRFLQCIPYPFRSKS